MHKRLMEFLNEQKIFYCKKYGFCKGFLTAPAIKASYPLHFADDTSLLNIQSSIKQINRTLIKDLKQLSLWLNANKISLNVAKTEVTSYKHKSKQLDTDLKLKYAENDIPLPMLGTWIF